MGRPKKDNHPISMRIATPVFNRLSEFCDETGLPKTITVEMALTEYMDKYYHERKLIDKIRADQ